MHCADGLWFQEAPDKLSLFDGSAVEWRGAAIRDTLAAYPNITGACLLTTRQEVVFSCVNAANTDGVLLVYDLRRRVWSVDPIGVVQAVVEYEGRLAFIQNGLVYLQAVTIGTGSFPTMSVRTGSFRLFTALGWGDIIKIGILGTWLGDCTLEGFISYDDGKTWTTMGSKVCTSSEYGVGDPLTIVFDPAQHRIDRFALRFDVTGTSNTAGARLHACSIEADAEGFTSRQPRVNTL